MEALIKQFLTPTPPTLDKGFGLSDLERNEFFHTYDDKEEFLNHLQEAEAMFKRNEYDFINPGLTGICRFENGEASGQDQSFFATVRPANRLFPEDTKDSYCQGFGRGNAPYDDEFPWFQHSSNELSHMPYDTHEIQEKCGYWFCNGYGIGRGNSVVSGDCIEEFDVQLHDENMQAYSQYLVIWDLQVSGGSNKGINKFNGEQLYIIDNVVVGEENTEYGSFKMEKDISVIFDHIHGNIAMVRYIDVDFSITKGYLIKEKNNNGENCFTFGETLHEAMDLHRNINLR